MSDDSRTCPSCGAHVPVEADRCDLCGTSVGASDAPGDPEDPSEPDLSSSTSEDADLEEGREEEAPNVFCNQCGWENPPGAQYCSRCGEELQDLSDPAPADTRRVEADLPSGTSASSDESTDTDTADTSDGREGGEQAAMGRQIALVVGGALVVVLGLFFVTQWSAQYEWESGSSANAPSAQAGADGEATASAPTSDGQGSMSAPGQGGEAAEPTDLQGLLDQTADSLTGTMADQIDSLETQIRQASGAEKQQLRTELVNLLIGAGHPGRAAVVQQDLAESTGETDAQRRAADLLYRWMQKLQEQGQREQVLQVARHAAQAYEAVAQQQPDDLDARTRMGETYLLTNEPMRGIEAINGVLEDDSTFVPARFQKGLALLQISRLDQAVQQFEMVKRFADEGSPFYRQADRALTVIEEQQARSSSGETAAPGN